MNDRDSGRIADTLSWIAVWLFLIAAASCSIDREINDIRDVVQLRNSK